MADLCLCPFCGSAPNPDPQNDDCPLPDGSGRYHQTIWCENCGAEGGKRRTDAEAIEAWNQRAATPVSEAEPVAWRDVLAERRRHVEAEGWTAAHDDEHGNGEMARAAASYALEHAAWTYTETPSARLMEAARSVWPWGKEWWKPGAGRRMLVKAAALILAEIERLDRKEGAR